VPFLLANGTESAEIVLLPNQSVSAPFVVHPHFIANARRSGFYRVAYDGVLFDRIVGNVRLNGIDVPNPLNNDSSVWCVLFCLLSHVLLIDHTL
jgi:hypothetical protein